MATVQVWIAWQCCAPMKFRFATPDDCPLLAQLNHKLIADVGLPALMTLEKMSKRMKAWLASDYRAILFEHGGKVVGYALYRELPEEIYLRQFFVVHSHRRRGIGLQAVRTLRSQVWPRTKRLTVEVLVTNISALAFWRKVGYRDHCLRLEIPPLQPQRAGSQADKPPSKKTRRKGGTAL